MEGLKEAVYSRELRITELINIGFQLFCKNIKTILLGVLWLGLPISLLLTIIQFRLMGFYDILDMSPTQLAAIPGAQLIEQMQQVLIYQLLAMAIDVFLVPIFVIGVAKATKWRLEGKENGYRSVFADAMLFEPTLVKVGIVYLICIVLGAFLFFPLVYLSVVWCFYVFCIGLGKRKGLDALGHSHMLVRGRWWKTLGYIFMMILVTVVGNMLFNFIFRSLLYVVPNHDTAIFVVNACYTCASYFVHGLYVSMMAVFFLNRESGLFGMQALQEEESVVE